MMHRLSPLTNIKHMQMIYTKASYDSPLRKTKSMVSRDLWESTLIYCAEFVIVFELPVLRRSTYVILGLMPNTLEPSIIL